MAAECDVELCAAESGELELDMSANTPKTDKRKAPKTAWKQGQSGNPAGRPKDGESWAAIIAAVGNMYPEDILAFVGRDNDLGREIMQLPKGVQMKYLVTARVFAALMFDPNPRMWVGLMERAEGKLNQPIEIRDEISEDERIERLTTILDGARARRDRQSSNQRPI